MGKGGVSDSERMRMELALISMAPVARLVFTAPERASTRPVTATHELAPQLFRLCEVLCAAVIFPQNIICKDAGAVPQIHEDDPAPCFCSSEPIP